MNPDPRKLCAEALKLPPAARAAVAGRLLDSLDEEADEDAETAWAVEIGRRLAQLDAGTVRTIPWAVARRRIAGR